MYAVIKTGGKQQKVRAGEVIEVEYMPLDPGSAVEFEPVLVVDDDGKPHVGKGLSEARVLATLLGDKKADKLKVLRYRPKSGYQRHLGHRQMMTVLEIQEVALSPDRVARKPEAEEEPAAKKPAAKKPAAKKPAAKKAAAKKAAAKKAAAKKTAAKKAAAKKSSSKKPSAKKPE